ncbi:hypothetical protein [Pelagibaculum spongiae]|uniref:Uncharacterized protein n=1 Tax=Pelagibaculum spongiae TaxID=2080658 RepID=A0A2V1GYE5_9GAMM|nr:hypothetical protein [Pelagibaculum spongiae]PVZ66783.1 hypothetical protein DC094_16095 [Pelagibaculum spongiae]
MYLLFSGEGPTDMGQGTATKDVCEGEEFLPGPMAWFVDQWTERKQYLSHIENQLCGFIPKPQLIAKAKASSSRRSLALRGKKNPEHETRYYYNNARAMAQIAKDVSTNKQDSVVAVLFRDSDGTQSSGRGEWKAKWDSMLDGFSREGFDSGVPMIPKPKSEAWLLCAVGNNYQHCESLENESGNDNGQNPLKDQLDTALGEPASRELLAEKVKSGEIDISLIVDMPSLGCFKDKLDKVLGTL